MFDKISKQFNSFFESVNELFNNINNSKKTSTQSEFIKPYEEIRKDDFILFDNQRIKLNEIFYYEHDFLFEDCEIKYYFIRICYKNGQSNKIKVKSKNQLNLLLHKLDNLHNVINLNTTEEERIKYNIKKE